MATARELEIETFSLYTIDDASHTLNSDHQIELPSPASYLDISKLIAVAKQHGINAVHPGYGFLSESAEFAKRMWDEAQVVVIGPGWDTLARTGDKLQAKALAAQCQVPTLPALQNPTDRLEDVERFAAATGFPIIIKAVDGGGGRGIRIVRKKEDLPGLLERCLRESPSGQVFAEKAAVDGYRHVEVQIVGDGFGNVRHLWERECSIQRRFQKVVEFAPSSIRDRGLVARVIESALRMAKAVNYLSLGTFEYLVRSNPPEFYFLEVNPRLQVEHTITESICMGIDLVRLQLAIASGQSLDTLIPHIPNNPRTPPPLHSIQLRVTAEDVNNNWSLSVGKIKSRRFPTGNGTRVDTNLLGSETVVKTDFDSLLAKLIITAPTWEDTVRKAKRALEDTEIDGIKTSLDALRGILHSDDFLAQNCDTQWLETHLTSILQTGQQISERAAARNQVYKPGKLSTSPTTSVAAPSTALFRKGDAWSITLAPDKSPQEATKSHLSLTRIIRNEFPASFSASINYTSATGVAQPYLLSLSSTSASASQITSTNRHRKGDLQNPNHIVVPFPGTLMEVLIDEGDVIRKGDVVAIVRQMKMELEIRAGKGGRVVWVSEVEDGEEVGEGLLLAEVGDEVVAAKL